MATNIEHAPESSLRCAVLIDETDVMVLTRWYPAHQQYLSTLLLLRANPLATQERGALRSPLSQRI